MPRDVFISYAFADKDVANAICKVLEERGISCWIAPRDVFVGESYAGAIIKAIHQAQLLVLVLSSHANASPHVERELESALGKRLPLLPFRIDDLELSASMQYFVRVHRWLNAFESPLEGHLDRLADVVKQWLSASVSEKTVSDLQPAQIRPRSTNKIITQVVGISYANNRKNRNGLIYRPSPLATDQLAPAPSYSPGEWQVICNLVKDLDEAVADVTRSALTGRVANTNGIAALTATLSHQVLPKQGFFGMLPREVHPQFDIVPDAAANIPWEVLEEIHGSCPASACPAFGIPQCSAVSMPRDCEKCGAPLRQTRSKLSLMYRLSFLTRGGTSPTPAGKRFLIISDPTGQLHKGQNGLNDANVQHIRDTTTKLEELQFDVEVLEGSSASVDRVRAEIRNPALAGIYYFGPDTDAASDSDDALLLADGSLRAEEISGVPHSAQLIFLNMWAWPGGPVPGYRRRIGGVASAFTAGVTNKVVIVPTWPMASTAAAQFAGQFCEHISLGTPLGESIGYARKRSLERHEAGMPDIGWLSYRYIGDPNRSLPGTLSTSVTWGHDDAVGRPICRVFDDKALLNSDIFSCPIDEFLLRAAKRRNGQGREQISITDLIAGMVRKGGVTRYALSQLGVDPDKLYEGLCAQHEEGPILQEPLSSVVPLSSAAQSGNDDASEIALRALLDRWIVREESQFGPTLVDLLISVDELSQRRSADAADALICEQDLLQAILPTEAWAGAAHLGLPRASDVANIIHKSETAKKIDKDGRVSLARLDASAKKIVEVAHLLAQQRGEPLITHRLLLAAFLANPSGVAANLCSSAGIDSQFLYGVMLAVTPDAPSLSYQLNLEACSRSVLPTIDAAGQSSDSPISEDDLFRAFCRVADPNFRSMLRDPPVGVDLAQLASAHVSQHNSSADKDAAPLFTSTMQRQTVRSPSPSQGDLKSPEEDFNIHNADFTNDGRRAIEIAAQLAQAQKWNTVRSPHLFAALLDDNTGAIATTLVSPKLSLAALRNAVLELVPLGTSDTHESSAVAVSKSTQSVLIRALQIAVGHGRAQATALDVFEAFFVEPNNVVGELLRHVGATIGTRHNVIKGGLDSIH